MSKYQSVRGRGGVERAIFGTSRPAILVQNTDQEVFHESEWKKYTKMNISLLK